jgi:hypothetical protein
MAHKQQQRSGVFCAVRADGWAQNNGIRHLTAGDKPIFSTERMLQRTITASVQLKKILAVSLKGLGAKTN